jgi:ATP-binding cassette subfamily B protein
LWEPGSGRSLLTDVSLTIRAGEKVAIVGPDEMEKHALVYLLPRFLDPSQGEIRIDGKNLRWVTLDSLRIQIAMVLQHNLVFNDTVANNIGCGDPVYNLQRITDAAKVAHAHQFISKLPQGYETVIGDLGHPLKLGEKFRIALARAILREPAILVIEETHVALDEDTKGMIDDTLQRVLPGRTVIFLPHRLSTIRACDQVFLLYEGKIEGAGVHRDLLNESELYRHLQYMEFNEYAGLVAPTTPHVEEPATKA